MAAIARTFPNSQSVERMQAGTVEVKSSLEVAVSGRQCLSAQWSQVRLQVAKTKVQLPLELQELAQAQQPLAKAQEQLNHEQTIFDRIRPVVEQGAVAELQLSRQEQEVSMAQDRLLAIQTEMGSAAENIVKFHARIEALQAEMVRLAKEELLRQEPQACREAR